MMKSFTVRSKELRLAQQKALAREIFEHIIAQLRQHGRSGDYQLVLLDQWADEPWIQANLGPFEVYVDAFSSMRGTVVVTHPKMKSVVFDHDGLTPAFKNKLWKRLLRNMPVDPPVETPLFMQLNFVQGVSKWLEELLCWRLNCERDQLSWEMIGEETPGNFHGYVHGPYDTKLELQINADKVRIVSYGARGATRTPSFRRHGYVYTAELEEWMRNFVAYMFYSFADHDNWVANQKTQPANSEAA